jgi:hypothetical protein
MSLPGWVNRYRRFFAGVSISCIFAGFWFMVGDVFVPPVICLLAFGIFIAHLPRGTAYWLTIRVDVS